MAITPDEIARRPFSPSVDGYHQGEVRTFLERIAGQLRALKAVQPEGQDQLVDLTMMLESHEPRLHQMEQRLQSMLAELQLATQQLASSQHLAIEQLSTTQRLATKQLEASQKLLESQRAAAIQQTVAQQASAQQAAAQQATVHQAAAQQAAQQAAAQQIASDHAAAQHAAAEQAAAAQRTAATQAAEQAAAAQQAAAERASAAAQTSSEVSRTFVDLNQTPTSETLSGELGDMFATDLDTQPLFSDSANDLLDGVLDDVMENLNDEGESGR